MGRWIARVGGGAAQVCRRKRDTRARDRWTALCALAALLGCHGPLERARRARDGSPPDIVEADRAYRDALQRPRSVEVARRELADLWVSQARARAKAGDDVEADAAYRRALEHEPHHPAALEGVARGLVDRGDAEAALPWTERAIAAGCATCTSLRAAILVERGDRASLAGDWAAAEAAYAEAMKDAPDAGLALALARARYGTRDLAGAATALGLAAAGLGPEDVQNQAHFLEVRRAVILLALHEHDLARVEALLDTVPVGVAIERQLPQLLELAGTMASAGHGAEAERRLTALVHAAAAGRIVLEPDADRALRGTLARLLVARAIQHGRAGRWARSVAALERAQVLDPENAAWAELHALFDVARGDTTAARAKVATLTDPLPTRAAVESFHAVALAEAGEAAAATEALAVAEAADPQAAEVHWARAVILARQSPAGVPAADRRRLERNSWIAYPDGQIVRAAEALAELARASRALEERSDDDPRQVLGVLRRVGELETRLRDFYPVPVDYRPQATAAITYSNTSAASQTVTLGLARPRSRAMQTAVLAPGETKTLDIRAPAVVELAAGPHTVVFLAEPHTHLSLSPALLGAAPR